MRFSCKVARSRKTSGRADDQDEKKNQKSLPRIQ
jgi:ubiquitin